MPEDKAAKTDNKKSLINIRDEKELRRFVGKGADYYFGKWKTIERTGNIVSFNLWAFLFGIFWMAYRKMYLFTFVVIVIIIAESVIEVVFDAPESLDRTASVVYGVMYALLGNYLYYVHIRKKLAMLRNDFTSPEKINEQIGNVGGTSWISVISLLVIVTGIIYIWIITASALG